MKVSSRSMVCVGYLLPPVPLLMEKKKDRLKTWREMIDRWTHCRVKSPPWSMNWGMTRWKVLPWYPKPFSPVHKARKFSRRILMVEKNVRWTRFTGRLWYDIIVELREEEKDVKIDRGWRGWWTYFECDTTGIFAIDGDVEENVRFRHLFEEWNRRTIQSRRLDHLIDCGENTSELTKKRRKKLQEKNWHRVDCRIFVWFFRRGRRDWKKRIIYKTTSDKKKTTTTRQAFLSDPNWQMTRRSDERRCWSRLIMVDDDANRSNDMEKIDCSMNQEIDFFLDRDSILSADTPMFAGVKMTVIANTKRMNNVDEAIRSHSFVLTRIKIAAQFISLMIDRDDGSLDKCVNAPRMISIITSYCCAYWLFSSKDFVRSRSTTTNSSIRRRTAFCSHSWGMIVGDKDKFLISPTVALMMPQCSLMFRSRNSLMMFPIP